MKGLPPSRSSDSSRAASTGSSGGANGSLSMTTSDNASPRTSTPSQKLALPRRTALPSRRKRASAARADHGQRGCDHRARMLVAVRIREFLRNVEQSLGSVVERAVPARGACVVQAHLAAVVAEIAGDRERRRRKNPSARVTVELPAENPRDGKRRGIQTKRVTEHLDPADQIGAGIVAPAFQQSLRRSRALGAPRKTLAAFGERFERDAYRA